MAAVPLQEEQGEAGAGEADADRPAREGAPPAGRRRSTRSRSAVEVARLRLPRSSTLRPHGRRGRRPDGGRGRQDAAHGRRRSRSSEASTSGSSARTARARRRSLETLLARPLGYGVVPAYFSQQGIELDTRGSVLDCAQRATGLQAAAGAEPARPLSLLRAGRCTSGRWLRSVRRRAAAPVARDPRRVRRELPRARRADEPPRRREPRGARGGARGVPRHGAARLPRPRRARRRRAPHARDRGADALRDYEGGWADYARAVAERATSGAQAPEPSTSGGGHSGPATRSCTERRRSLTSSGSRPRSRRRSSRCETSSGGSPRTGRTSTPPLPTAARARSSRRCSRRWEALFGQTTA